MRNEGADDADAQDQLERWVILQVRQGRPVVGLYPPTEASRAEYERWRAEQQEQQG